MESSQASGTREEGSGEIPWAIKGLIKGTEAGGLEKTELPPKILAGERSGSSTAQALPAPTACIHPPSLFSGPKTSEWEEGGKSPSYPEFPET